MNKHIHFFLVLIGFLSALFFITDFKVQAQVDTTNISSHYVLPEFVVGKVIMKDGRTEYANMDYNKLTEEMIFEKDGVMLALDSLVAIETVNIDNRIFVPHGNIFFEVLVIGPVSLYMQHKSNILIAGNPSGYGGTSETGAARNLSSLTNTGRAYKLTLPSDYHITEASKFWLRKGDTFYKANNSAQVRKIFPEKSKEINAFIKQKKLDLTKSTDMVTLVLKCNEFVK
jgi:hypothetical protein